jgi:trk system potassium uptake protein
MTKLTLKSHGGLLIRVFVGPRNGSAGAAKQNYGVTSGRTYIVASSHAPRYSRRMPEALPSSAGAGKRNPAVEPRGTPSEGPPPPVKAGSRALVALCVLVALLSAASWWFPLRGTLSLALLSLTSLLSLPWGFLLLKRDHEEPAPGVSLVAAAASSSSRVFALRLLLVALLGGFLLAQWLILLRADGHPALAGTSRSYSLAILLVTALSLFARSMPATRLMAVVSDHPARLMALSFGGAGGVGAAVLSLPISVQHVGTVSLVDNLFMAFSAVCVTGLAVNNVATTYTLFGQVVLCVLIQIGGLGIMVLSAAFAIIARQKLRVKSSAVIAQMVDASSLASMRRTVLISSIP